MQIAIDGPAASGKSTAARLLARRLGFVYIDTGAMYRAVTLMGLQNKIDFDDPEAIAKTAKQAKIELLPDTSGDRGFRVILNGARVTSQLFTPEVDRMVSITARTSAVRRILVKAQQELAQKTDVVMAGRDIGSNVLPDARLKIFLVADITQRARRRQAELSQKGQVKELEEIEENLRFRDKTDSGRTENPLVKTADAFEVDSSFLTIEQMVDEMETEARLRMAD